MLALSWLGVVWLHLAEGSPGHFLADQRDRFDDEALIDQHSESFVDCVAPD